MHNPISKTSAAAFAAALIASLSQPAQARDVRPPPVPTGIQVPAGHTAVLKGRGVGTQNYEKATIRAAWQHSRDTSIVWAAAAAPPSFDPAFVAPGAVPWLLLEVVGKQEGPNGGDTLLATTFIQRVNTAGGVAPATGCSALSDVGKKAFVPYRADYFFFEREDRY